LRNVEQQCRADALVERAQELIHGQQ
nr:RecName: Full=Ribosome-inactivating protein charantin; AltName: Full=rRNA N-glycosidase [Momordica charantia]